MDNAKQQGSISVVTGSMFSGKTEELLRRIRRAEIAGLRCVVLKPEIDKRYHENKVVSHNNNQSESLVVNQDESIYKRVQGYQLIAIDEAQFFGPQLLDDVERLCKQGVRVIAVGLDMDFNAKPFGIMPQLMAMADDILKLHAICTRCGEQAQFSFRKVESQNQISLGGTDEYTALCRRHYLEAKATHA